ncbi:hypothetical protein QQ045_029936 [Rhodiola kirilowii]
MRLLLRGYTVHVTSTNLAQVNVQVLKNLAGANSQLKLFEADICDKEAVQQAIQGCYYAIHMATPFPPHTLRFKDTPEAAVAGVKSIVKACVKSGTAKRLIYTGTVVSASPLKDAATDHTLYHESINESCWTSIDTDLPLANSYLLVIEVVSLVAGLTGGDTILGSAAGSLKILLSQIRRDEATYGSLRFIEEVDGKVPVVHVEDVCNAHIYCMENPSISGRFLCANGYIKTTEISDFCAKHYPSIHIPQRMIEDKQRSIRWGSTKLQDVGFQYQYDADATLEQSIKCGV